MWKETTLRRRMLRAAIDVLTTSGIPNLEQAPDVAALVLETRQRNLRPGTREAVIRAEKGEATAEDITFFTDIARNELQLSLCEELGGLDGIYSYFGRLVAENELTHRSYAGPKPLQRSQTFKRLLEVLELSERASFTDVLKIVLNPSGLAAVQSKGVNEYWQARLVLEGANSFYTRRLPLEDRHIYLGTYRLRKQIKLNPLVPAGDLGKLTAAQAAAAVAVGVLLINEKDGSFVVNPLFADEAERKFVTKVIAGAINVRYVFDGPNRDVPPPPPHMTFQEARADAISWELYADTVGGSALIYNVETGEETHRF
jgi:hypothetical protein